MKLVCVLWKIADARGTSLFLIFHFLNSILQIKNNYYLHSIQKYKSYSQNLQSGSTEWWEISKKQKLRFFLLEKKKNISVKQFFQSSLNIFNRCVRCEVWDDVRRCEVWGGASCKVWGGMRCKEVCELRRCEVV